MDYVLVLVQFQRRLFVFTVTSATFMMDMTLKIAHSKKCEAEPTMDIYNMWELLWHVHCCFYCAPVEYCTNTHHSFFCLTSLLLDNRSRFFRADAFPLAEATALDIEQTSKVAITGENSYWLYSSSHTHPFNGPFSGTTQVSQYQKGKTNLDFTEARDSEWQWHQLDQMQVCTSLQTDNHTSTHHSVFYRQDALPAAQPTASKHWRHPYSRDKGYCNVLLCQYSCTRFFGQLIPVYIYILALHWRS